MPDYEVEITAHSTAYPPGLSDDECTAMEHNFDVLVTAEDEAEAEQKTIDHLRKEAIVHGEYEFTPALVTRLDPGEEPCWGDADAGLDLRETKMPYVKHNRQLSELPTPPPGLEHLANASTEELVEELRKNLAVEDEARARVGRPPRRMRRPN
jgi:hypothetical protein